METIISITQHFISHFMCCYYPKIQAILLPGTSLVVFIGVCKQQLINIIKKPN